MSSVKLETTPTSVADNDSIPMKNHPSPLVTSTDTTIDMKNDHHSNNNSDSR